MLQLRQLLGYLRLQLQSVLSESQIGRIFAEHENYDLRRLLDGTETVMDALVDGFGENPAYLLEAVPVLRMPPALRDELAQSLLLCLHPVRPVLYTLIVPPEVAYGNDRTWYMA